MTEEVVDLGVPGLDDAVLVGSGGFGRVYRANQPAFRRAVAVKVLDVPALDQRTRRQFDEECQAIGSVSDHSGIVTVHDAGTTAHGRPYLVMSYLSGGSLGDRLENDGPVGWERTVSVGAVLADALGEAHQAGVLHCDVKPANVLLSRFGQPQLADFGISRVTGDDRTHSARLAVTVPYAAPELFDGQQPSTSTDIYALGATLHELITGHLPFDPGPDEGQLSLIRRILTDDPPDLREQLAPPDVAACIHRAMAKDPDERQPSARALAAELNELAAMHGVAERAAFVVPPEPHDGPAVPRPSRPPVSETPAPAAPASERPPPPRPVTTYVPTHRVPRRGTAARLTPHPSAPVSARLDPGLDVQVVEWWGDWAQIVCSNGWGAWVDGRTLKVL